MQNTGLLDKSRSAVSSLQRYYKIMFYQNRMEGEKVAVEVLDFEKTYKLLLLLLFVLLEYNT
ncbi:hypothetical protein OB13_01535 [Pontibacter sp. HJ8]